MIRTALRLIVMVPVAAVLVALAVANRQLVTVSFDPFDPSDRDLALAVPLYQMGFAILIAGVVLGGAATWLKQRKWRRTAAGLAAEMGVMRAELEHSKRQAAQPDGRSPTRPTEAARTLPAA